MLLMLSAVGKSLVTLTVLGRTGGLDCLLGKGKGRRRPFHL